MTDSYSDEALFDTRCIRRVAIQSSSLLEFIGFSRPPNPNAWLIFKFMGLMWRSERGARIALGRSSQLAHAKFLLYFISPSFSSLLLSPHRLCAYSPATMHGEAEWQGFEASLGGPSHRKQANSP